MFLCRHSKQCTRKCVRLKRLKIVDPFTKTDKPDRKLSLGGNGQYHAPFCSPIKLRQDKSGHVRCFPKLHRLLQPILSGRGIEYQQYLMRRSLETFSRCATDLAQLFHEMSFRV